MCSAARAFVVFVLIAMLSPVATRAHNEWQPGPEIPVARSEFGAAVLNGSIYVAGGFGAGSRVDRFDPVEATWSFVTDIPLPVHHAAVAAHEGRLFVAGGYDLSSHEAVPYVWAFDPVQEVWSAMPDLPHPRGAFGLASLGGSLYAVGGADDRLGGPVSGQTLRLEPGARAWSAMAAMPTPREHLAVIATADSLYAVGGRADGDEGDAFAAAFESYDPSTDRWTTLPPLPTPRGGLAGVAIPQGIVVIGGERGDELFAAVDLFDLSTGTWRRLPDLTTARHGVAAAVAGETMYAIAGSTLAGRVENTAVMETLLLTSMGTPQP